MGVSSNLNCSQHCEHGDPGDLVLKEPFLRTTLLSMLSLPSSWSSTTTSMVISVQIVRISNCPDVTLQQENKMMWCQPEIKCKQQYSLHLLSGNSKLKHHLEPEYFKNGRYSHTNLTSYDGCGFESHQTQNIFLALFILLGCFYDILLACQTVFISLKSTRVFIRGNVLYYAFVKFVCE